MSWDDTPEQELRRLRSIIRQRDQEIGEHALRLRQLLSFYRQEVRSWCEVGQPAYMRGMLAAYRLSIRTMLGMEV